MTNQTQDSTHCRHGITPVEDCAVCWNEPEQCEECATDLRDDEGIHCDKCQADLDAWFHGDRSDQVTPEAEAWHNALMFPAVDAAIPAPYGAAQGYRYSPWPRTVAFFAETVAASAMRPEAPKRVPPTLCPAVCPTHHRGCALHITPPPDSHTQDGRGNTFHLCQAGGWGHHFLATS